MSRTGGASQDELLLDIREHIRLHMPDPFTCALSEARASRWFAKKRTGIGLLYDVSIKDVPVPNGASVALGDQITSLLGMLKPNAPRQAVILFIHITVMLDVLSFVDREAQLPHERRGLFVQPLVSFIRQGVRSDIPAHRHR